MSIVRRTLAGAVALAVALGFAVTTAPAAVAAEDDAVFLLTKAVNPNTSPYEPGEQLSYTIELTCNSNLVDTCVNAQLVDTLPAPLVFDPAVADPVVVSGGGTSSVAVDGTSFTVDFTSVGEAGTGQPAGQKATVTVFVQVPTDISADYNDVDIVNTVNAAADNALPESAAATITLNVPEVLDSTVTKSVDDHQDGTPIPALPDQPVDYAIGGGNASNRSVDAIVVQDPADGVASPFDEYLDFTGITSITPPAGADQVEIEWLDADGVWHVAYPTGPIPADPSGIPDVDPLSQVKGLRFTFTSSTGDQLPPSGDQPARIGVSAATNDAVLEIPAEEAVEVPNTASSNIVVHDTASEPKTADGNAVISNTGPTVEVTKEFADPNLLAGEQTTATIIAVNGFRPVTSMVIQEPSPGAPDLAAQGLEFEGFADGIEWPPNASDAEITYVYADGSTETLSTSEPNTLPGPTAQDESEVVGFTVEFTGPIVQNARAVVPFTVTAEPLEDGEDAVSTNETTSTVTDQTGKSGDDEDSADVTRQPGRVSTVVTKNIARDELWAVPGSSTDVSFDAKVNDEGENASTIGADELIVSDPAAPQPGDPISPFWNTFDLSRVVVGVPANADLQVNYWDGDSWEPLPGGQLDGEGTLVLSVPSGTAPVTREQIQGIQFVFTPKDGEQLPPGFHVVPSITVETRDEFRDGSGSVADAAEAENPLEVANTAGSEVVNPDDVTPEDNTATDTDDIDLLPIDGGDGPDLFEKHWLVDPEEPLFAFSGDQRTARISWSTEGLPFDTVAITDDAAAAPGFDDAAIAGSAFDAWNLAEIAAIDETTDPAMRYDRVSRVELFSFDSVAGSGAWVDVTDAACPTADACDGAFPGYALSSEERESTRAVRLTYAEGSDRGSGEGPAPGTGVAPSYDHDRALDLVFELRDFTRSDGGPVTGTLHSETFNSGQPGVVINTAEIIGDGPAPIDQTDSDPITILDSTVNTSVTKTFDQDALPIPPAGTAAESYPLATATITARNETEASVQTLRITDPAPGSATDVYEFLNLFGIESISIPAEATESTVVLTREGGDADAPISVADALALEPGDLADVTGVEVVHTDPDGVSIETTESSSVVLTYQLRQLQRGSGEPVTTADFATNVAGSEVTRPGDDPELDTAGSTATDTLGFADATYGVVAQKDIQTPPTSADGDDRVENEPREGYTVTLTGQPTGNVRTTVLTITDDEPTFWNAFDFASFPTMTLPENLHQVRVSALTGVDWGLDAGTDAPVYTCEGAEDLADCWETGEWQEAASDGTVVPSLPAGVDPSEVRGIRFEIRVDDEASNWERPSNPVVTVAFTADQRETLHIGPEGESESVPVPSTRPGQPTAPGEPEPGTTTDVVDVHGDGAWEGQAGSLWEADDDASDTTRLLHLRNAISVEKVPGNGEGGSASQQFPPASRIPYTMTITNTGDWPITGLELEDEVASDAEGSLLVPVPGVDPTFGFALEAGDGTELDASGFSGELDVETGEVTITVPDGFVFEPGDVLTITAALQFRDGVPPGTPVGNTITATSDRTFDECDSTSFAVANPAQSDVDACAANTTVNPLAAAPISLQKAVKGTDAGVPGAPEDDPNRDDLGVLNTADPDSAEACATPNAGDGFYRNTCVPITRPGGTETWRVTFTNLGNVPARAIAGIDVLPAIGDTGVTVGTSRGSEWAPVFVGNVQPGGTATNAVSTLFYLTTTPALACNAADIEYSALGTAIPVDDPCFSDVSSRVWIPFTNDTPLEELAQAKAIKTVVEWPEGEGLAPGSEGSITFDTVTPLQLPEAPESELPIAWNAIAAGSRADFDDQAIYQGPVEPVRSGVAVPTGEIELVKQVETDPDPWPAALPDDYDFEVQCTSGGDGVVLVDADGATAATVSVPADGTPVPYGAGTNLPLYADCTVQEVPSQGAAVSYDPAGADGRSGEVTARRDLSGMPDVHHGAPDDEALERITATNAYELGGFSITKTVVNEPGAVDQDGRPIEFDPEFGFTASCLFLDEETLAEDDRSFTLQDGETRVFDDVPVGAECAIEEVDVAGATGTGIVVSENGEQAQSVDGTTAEFTVLPDDEDAHATVVSVTNRYTVGSIEITKDVTGAGVADWASAEFEVRLVCTWDQADPDDQTVYDATRTIVADETWRVDDLPTGAACTVTEPESGGATEVTVEPNPVTIGIDGTEGSPVTVAVVNDYRVGGFEVAKTVSGSGGGFSEGVEFTFEYVCSLDGVPLDPALGGSGTLTIMGDGTAGPLVSDPVTGLPVGSECVVTETGAGGADAVPEPVTVVIPDEEDGVAQMVTAELENRFTAGTISITKTVDGEASLDPDYADLIADATYTVHVTCSMSETGAPLFDGDVEVTGGETVEILDPVSGDPLLLPGGAHCWGEETDAAGATSASVDFDSFDNAAIVEASDDELPQPIEITATNTFDLGELIVAKELSGDAASYADDTTFEILVTCELDRGAGNEPIVSYDAEPVELHGGEAEVLTGIPLGSSCSAEEPDGQGAWSIDISATADDPVIVDGGDDDITITVTNVFPDAGFSVTKAVTTDAVDQDGGAITTRLAFGFSAVCTFEDETVLDMRFLLRDGATREFSGLPAGADCTVEEFAARGAETSLVLTQNGEEDDLGDTNSADFVLQPDVDDQAVTAVTVSNFYPVGSIEIVKSVTGSGADAWAGTFGDFEVRLVCTLPEAAPSTVYDGTHVLTRDAPGDVWLVENLPTGAECAVTETDDGGATESTVTPGTILVGDARTEDPVRVDIVNDFRTGALDVLKQVAGPGAEEFGGGPFVFGVLCTYEGQTVVEQELVVETDGGEGPFRSDTITGIPVGTECTVTETDAAGADAAPAPVTVTIPDQEDGVETIVSAAFLNVFSLPSHDPSLSGTGAHGRWAMIGGAATLLLAGAAAITIALGRRRRR
ncbi:DUF5979 domain-containing protein [Leucobacter triazinivorans]|uniref:DUF5979 domain-containing protein n=1 Tax=Leucobacter triazinivorans TaxID=1784719 RepID=A0A4V0Z1M5_9MICO|nr:DUF5979 domain-containing protein [Leucobacter triazinivorans]QBE48929.1 hypothetical protein EVS81_08840 [Leucobacter triazinivorans]